MLVSRITFVVIVCFLVAAMLGLLEMSGVSMGVNDLVDSILSVI